MFHLSVSQEKNGNNDLRIVTVLTFWRQSRYVGVILMTFSTVGDIFNGINRSSARFVSDSRHQHRCGLEKLFVSMVMGTYRN